MKLQKALVCSLKQNHRNLLKFTKQLANAQQTKRIN